MSTLYYYRSNVCPHCGRYEEKQLALQSAGHPFHFYGEESKLMKKVAKPEYQIADEIGHVYSFVEFASIVESHNTHYSKERK